MTGISTDDADEYTTVGPDAVDYARYATVTLADGAVLLYDREYEEAWIQSDAPVDVAETA
jgi:hypothetical protein